MGKRGDLWDDSALVDAFETAMSKFKVMHNTVRYEEKSMGLGDANVKLQALGEFANSGCGETERCVEGLERDKDSSNLLTISAKSEHHETLTSAGEQRSVDVQAYDAHIEESTSFHTQDKDHYLPESQDDGNYLPESQGLDDYYQLCKEHLELEEKRLQLWYRFQQYNGGWNYQYPGGSYQTYTPCDGGDPTFQVSPSPDQGSHPIGSALSCPCASASSVPPSSSLPSCSLCGPCCCVAPTTDTKVRNNARDPPAVTESDIVRIGVEAAEKAMSVLKVKPSDLGVEIGKCGSKDTSTSKDLNDVLKAWYTAGLYTGKYLTEKSLISKQDG